MQTNVLFEQKQRDSYLPHYTLNWRRRQLLVRLSEQVKHPSLSLPESENFLVERLSHSPVQLVRLDPNLGEIGLRLWANACKKANKAVFLWVPSAQISAKKTSLLRWQLKRLADWGIAALLLLALSPALLGLVLLLRVYSPGPILCQQWCVGKRGKLFQMLKLRTVSNTEKLFPEVNGVRKGPHEPEGVLCISSLGHWMHKYSIDKLPQLFNVLRGEMSLVGPRAWTLDEAAHLGPDRRRQLSRLPGILETWQ